jgi:hypothetical protein
MSRRGTPPTVGKSSAERPPAPEGPGWRGCCKRKRVRCLQIVEVADAEAMPTAEAATSRGARETPRPLGQADTVSAPRVESGSSTRRGRPATGTDAPSAVRGWRDRSFGTQGWPRPYRRGLPGGIYAVTQLAPSPICPDTKRTPQACHPRGCLRTSSAALRT